MFTQRITPELSLAIIDPKFARDYVEILKSDINRVNIGQWLDFANQDGIDTESYYLSFIKECLEQFAEGTGYPCVMIYQGQVAGNIIFNNINQKTGSADLGYWIRSELQSKGITSHAVQAMIEIAFTELNITRIQVRCATKNIASRAIPEKFGFKLEGIIRQSACIRGQILDYAVYGLLKNEWK